LRVWSVESVDDTERCMSWEERLITRHVGE
jgi:hypothetical protein